MRAGLEGWRRVTGVTLRWGGKVHDIGSRGAQHVAQVMKVLLDRESLVQLARHQRLAVTNRYNFAVPNALDLRRVIVGDLSATHNCDLKHLTLLSGSLRNGGEDPRWLAPWGAIPLGPST